MSILHKNVTISVEEYLEGEKYSTVKHEYVAGRVHAMVGASSAHNLIAWNLHAALHAHLRGKPCRVFMADMKPRVADAFYYPDLMVTCDPLDRHEYYRERPVLAIEVLSPATEKTDTLDKRVAYQSLASLQEYAMVAQDKMEVRILRRSGEDWDLEIYTEGDCVRFATVDLDLPIEAIYEDVWS